MPRVNRRKPPKRPDPIDFRKPKAHYQNRLKEIAAELNLEKTTDVIQYLVDFHDMKHIDDVTKQIRRLEVYGPSLVQMAQLSVLYTILTRIAESLPNIGLHWRGGEIDL
jgi:hypothetical protein